MLLPLGVQPCLSVMGSLLPGRYALASCWSWLTWVQRSSLCFCPSGCPGLQKRFLTYSLYLESHFLGVSQPAPPVCNGSGHGHLPVPTYSILDQGPRSFFRKHPRKESVNMCARLCCRKGAQIHQRAHLVSGKYWLYDLWNSGLNSGDLIGWLWKFK